MFVLLLGGCGLGDLFSTDSEDLRLRAVVRDELDRREAEEGPKRRQYVEDQVTAKLNAQASEGKRIDALESKIGKLETDLDIVSRQFEKRIDLGMSRSSGSGTRAAEAPTSGAVKDLRTDVDAALKAVSKLQTEMKMKEAQRDARFERLELRTSQLDWPATKQMTALHLASYRSQEAAIAGWKALQAEYPDLLGPEDPSYVEVDTVAGMFVRLMVGAGASHDWLVTARDLLRDSGEYAMIMPLPVRGEAEHGDAEKAPAAPKVLVPGS